MFRIAIKNPFHWAPSGPLGVPGGCKSFGSILSAWIDEELKPVQARRLDAHVNQCKSCSDEVAAMLRCCDVLRDLDEVPISPDLQASIRAAIRAEATACECARMAPLLSAFIDDELTGPVSAWVAAHTASCSQCASLLAEARQASSLLSALPALDPPGLLHNRILAATTRRPALYRPVFAGSAILAAAALVFAFVPWRSHRAPHRPPVTVAALRVPLAGHRSAAVEPAVQQPGAVAPKGPAGGLAMSVPAPSSVATPVASIPSALGKIPSAPNTPVDIAANPGRTTDLLPVYAIAPPTSVRAPSRTIQSRPTYGARVPVPGHTVIASMMPRPHASAPFQPVKPAPQVVGSSPMASPGSGSFAAPPDAGVSAPAAMPAPEAPIAAVAPAQPKAIEVRFRQLRAPDLTSVVNTGPYPEDRTDETRANRLVHSYMGEAKLLAPRSYGASRDLYGTVVFKAPTTHGPLHW